MDISKKAAAKAAFFVPRQAGIMRWIMPLAPLPEHR
jgi:hypothetical protein